MDWIGVSTLAATRAESTAGALALAVLSSCLLLAIYRPRRTELEGTPHRVPLVAVCLSVAWTLLAAGAHLVIDPAQVQQTLSQRALWLECAQSAVVLLIIASAYLIPREIQRGVEAAAARPATLDSEELKAFELITPAPGGGFPGRRRLPEDWPHHIAVGLTVGLAVLLPTSILGSFLVPDRDVSESHILLRTLQGKGWEYLVPIILAAVVLAPLLEELLFRVVLQGWLSDLVGKQSIPLAAGIFALIHGPSDAALLVPLALSLGALYEYRRSYLEVVAAHAAFNAANLFAAVNAG